jgi:hypothetical protein
MTNPIRPDILDLLPHAKPTFIPPIQPESPAPEEPKISFMTKAISLASLAFILTGIWAVGQFSIGIPDEVILNFFMVLLYNWFVKNGYKVPNFFNKIK